MALDFQQVYQKIKEIGATVQQRKKTLEERRAHARFLLNLNADALDALRYKIESAKAADPNIRCALPLNERLDFHAPPPALPLNATLIAADGSQINPDRHGAVQFGLINVGAIVLRLNSGASPIIRTESQLLFDDELFTASGNPLTDGMVALRRDLKERAKLYDLAAEFGSDNTPVVTFTDGPIELWGAKDGEDASAFEEGLTNYLSVLSRLQERGVTTAGYVDKPAADLVIRLLELTEATPEDLQKLREYHPLRGVSDRWLFGEKNNPLLKPGERSAVFAFQSKSEKYYKGVLALHFFYLNAGTEGRPWPVRVEIPQWVAADAEKLGMLHAVLVSQCRMMGEKPYPYLLHRSHEIAVVSHEERQQVEQMLNLELRRNGGETDDGSNKQSAKDLPGKTRY
jgi:hypothetical protein